jgi:prepilin peptidase CpaA
MNHLNVLFATAAAIASVAALTDVKRGVIPNWLTLSALTLGAALRVFLLRESSTAPLGLWLAEAAIGVVLCGLVPFVMWKKEAIGGGDVKLLAALGGLLGPLLGMEAELYAFLFALLFAPIKLAFEGKLLKVAHNALRVLVNPFLPKSRQVVIAPELLHELRFGPAVLAGVLLAAALHWTRSS